MTKEQNKKAPNLRFKGFTNDWEQRKLKTVVSVNSGKDYKSLEKGNIPVYGTGGYITSVSKFLSNQDAIGLGRKGTINKPYILKAPFWTVDTLFYLTLKPENILTFIYSLIQKINWLKYDESTGLPSLSKKNIENVLVYLTKLDEQQKIGKLIVKLDKLITLQQRKLELLSQLKQGLIQQNILNQALLNSSSSWPSYKLKDLLKVRKKLQIPDIKYPLASFTVEKGVTSKTSRYNREFLVQTHNKKYKSTEYHDIVYNPANLKFGAIALNKFGKATISPIYETLVPSSKCNVYFLTLIITSPDFIHKALKYQEGTVYERMAVKVNDLLSMSIHLPNIDTQVKFGEFFYGLDELIYATKNKLEKYQLIKKSLLQQMFI